MPRKLKFRPRISRVKLNPEQAVLSCNCYDLGSSLQWIGQPAGAFHVSGTGVDCSGKIRTQIEGVEPPGDEGGPNWGWNSNAGVS